MKSNCGQVMIVLSHQSVYLQVADAEKVLALLPEAIREVKEQKIADARKELDRARAKLKALGEDC